MTATLISYDVVEHAQSLSSSASRRGICFRSALLCEGGGQILSSGDVSIACLFVYWDLRARQRQRSVCAQMFRLQFLKPFGLLFRTFRAFLRIELSVLIPFFFFGGGNCFNMDGTRSSSSGGNQSGSTFSCGIVEFLGFMRLVMYNVK